MMLTGADVAPLPRWLGWPNNMQGAVSLYANLIKAAEVGGKPLVRGLATDIANYTPRERQEREFYVPPAVIDFLSASSQAGLHGASACCFLGAQQRTV